VQGATGGAEALTILKTYKGQVGLLPTDVFMAKMSGRELAKAVHTPNDVPL